MCQTVGRSEPWTPRDTRGFLRQVLCRAYFWARLAELRLRAGELQSMARQRAELAAKFFSAFELGDADKLVKSLIATASEPMNK